jgi:hypothetical protein
VASSSVLIQSQRFECLQVRRQASQEGNIE